MGTREKERSVRLHLVIIYTTSGYSVSYIQCELSNAVSKAEPRAHDASFFSLLFTVPIYMFPFPRPIAVCLEKRVSLSLIGSTIAISLFSSDAQIGAQPSPEDSLTQLSFLELYVVRIQSSATIPREIELVVLIEFARENLRARC